MALFLGIVEKCNLHAAMTKFDIIWLQYLEIICADALYPIEKINFYLEQTKFLIKILFQIGAKITNLNLASLDSTTFQPL